MSDNVQYGSQLIVFFYVLFVSLVFYVLFVSVVFYALFVCKCVLYYCHRVSTQLQLTNTSYHISMQQHEDTQHMRSDWPHRSPNFTTFHWIWPSSGVWHRAVWETRTDVSNRRAANSSQTPVRTKQHGVISQKTVMFKIAARRASKLTCGWFSLLELQIRWLSLYSASDIKQKLHSP